MDPQIEETSRPTICCPTFGKDFSRKVADYVDGRVLHSEPVKPSTKSFLHMPHEPWKFWHPGEPAMATGFPSSSFLEVRPRWNPPKNTVAEESPNQDSWCMLKTDDFSIYGVFDGHGQKGALPRGHDFSGEKGGVFGECGCCLSQKEVYIGMQRYADFS